MKDSGHNYFISVLATASIPHDQRTLAGKVLLTLLLCLFKLTLYSNLAFILTTVVDDCRPGQSACLAGKLISICLAAIGEPYPMLRKWVALCLAKLWEDYDEAKWVAVRELAHQRLCVLLTDPAPEVSATNQPKISSFDLNFFFPLSEIHRCERRLFSHWGHS